MRLLRRILVFFLVRTLIVGVVGTGALYFAVGGQKFWQIQSILREEPHSALTRAAAVLGR